MGGARRHAPMSADVTLKAGWERVQTLEPDASGRKVVLPDARTLRPGGPQFVLINIDATESLEVEDAAGGTVIAALAAQEGVFLGLADATTLAGTWSKDVRSL